MTACCSSTFAVRKGIVPILVSSALCAAAFLGTPSGSAVPPALDPAQLFPAGSPLMISIDGGPCTQFGKELAISKIVNDPEVQEFLKSSLELAREAADSQVRKFATEMLGVTVEELEALAKMRIAVAVTKFEMPKEDSASGDPRLDLMLAAELRGSQKAVESLLKAAEKHAATAEMTVTETTVGGIPAKKMTVPPHGPFDSVTYLFHEGWLLAATSSAQLEAALARAKSGDPAGSLGSDPLFASTMKEVVRPKTIFSLFVNLGFVLETAGGIDPGIKSMLSGFGLETLKAEGIAMELDGASIRERAFVATAPNSPFSKLIAPVDVAALAARIPRRAYAAWAGSLNFKEYFALLTKAMSAVPMAGEEMDQALGEVDKVLGSGWREDLLGSLGPEIVAFAAMPQYGFFPDLGVMVRVSDRAKVESRIAKALDRPKVKAAHRSVKHGEATINYLDLGTMEIDRGLNARPAWVFVDDYLLVTYSPHNAKSILHALAQKDGGLMARDDFAKTFARLKAENPNAGNAGIAYLDVAWSVGSALDTFIPVLQSVVPPDALDDLGPVKLDLGKIPSTQAITKYLSGVVMQSQTKEGGMYSEIVSPTGVIGTFAVLGTAGAWFSMLEARSAFAEAEAMEPEPPVSRPVPADKDEDR